MNWVPHDTRDQVVNFLRHWSERTELPAKRLLGWAELCPRKGHGIDHNQHQQDHRAFDKELRRPP